MRPFILFVLGLALLGCEPTNPLVASLKSADVPNIPFEKYSLPNGLTVILHQDTSHPLVHVDMTYHVGSAREAVGKSGFAHFFEHMMFQGSKHVGDQQHFKIVTEAGGDLNGTTNRDRTNYYQTVPANQLEKVLWLESDRMGFLLEAVSEKKFEIQRDTVKNERAQNYENRPYGLVGETLAQALYPDGHPYSWSTIGYVDDLNSVNLNDLKEFFLRWYGPNNATLTIGGDIDIAQTKAWIEKYFADIPRGPDVADAPKQPVHLDKDRYVTLEDRIEQPLLVMAWPTQYPDAEQTLALDLVGAALGQGRNSALYQALVKTEKAMSADAYQVCGELACHFQVTVLAKEGEPLAPLAAEVIKVIDTLKVEGIDTDVLAQAKAIEEADMFFSLESVSGKVSQLASNQTFYQTPDRMAIWSKRLNEVTIEQANQALKAFVWKKPSVQISVVPNDQQSLAAHSSNFQFQRKLPSRMLVADADLKLRETPMDFDRAQVPVSSGAVVAKTPKIYRTALSNGIQVQGVESTETPTVAIYVQFPAGDRMVPAGKNGLADLTAQMLMEGTKQYSAEDLSAQLDRLGAQIDVQASATQTTLSISTLKKHLPEIMTLAEDVLFSPKFAPEDFERLKQQMLESILLRQQSPQFLAAQARREIFYQTPWFDRPASGDVESITSLTLDDVKAFYQQNYTADQAKLIAVGDVSEQTLVSVSQNLAKWSNQPAKSPVKPELKTYEQQQIWLVDKPNAPQSIVQWVRHGPLFDATGEMFQTQLANFNLAGNFNSRLNLNLREDKGYTYGASGSVVGSADLGMIIFSTQARADVTGKTIEEIRDELARYVATPQSQTELEFMRLSVGQRDALNFETPYDNAAFISTMMRHQLPDDYKQQQNDIVQQIEAETLHHLAKKWFTPKDFQIIVVGDKTTLLPQLKTLGIPIRDLKIEI